MSRPGPKRDESYRASPPSWALPRSENRVRDRLVQDWHFADGSSVEIVFQDGKLVSKSQRQAGQATAVDGFGEPT